MKLFFGQLSDDNYYTFIAEPEENEVHVFPSKQSEVTTSYANRRYIFSNTNMVTMLIPKNKEKLIEFKAELEKILELTDAVIEGGHL
jgi:hypothetical protein